MQSANSLQNVFFARFLPIITITVLTLCNSISPTQGIAADFKSACALSTADEIFGTTNMDDFTSNVGINQMVEMVNKQSPIKRLSEIAGGSMGARLGAVMGIRPAADVGSIYGSQITLDTGEDAPMDNIIIDQAGDTTTGVLNQIWQIYPSRISINFNELPTQYDEMYKGTEQGSKHLAKINDNIKTQLERKAVQEGKTPSKIQAEFISGVLVLKGNVSDEREKKVFELMVKMEPGVKKIRNELVVDKPQSDGINKLSPPAGNLIDEKLF
ncbi:MAG: BON domain-containing protein [Thermoguttaceae bacterium]